MGSRFSTARGLRTASVWRTLIRLWRTRIWLALETTFGAKPFDSAAGCEYPDSAGLAGEHEFWEQNEPVFAMSSEIMVRLMGPRKMSNAVLLDRAVKRGGCLATLDKGILSLVPKGSGLAKHIELIPS